MFDDPIIDKTKNASTEETTPSDTKAEPKNVLPIDEKQNDAPPNSQTSSTTETVNVTPNKENDRALDQADTKKKPVTDAGESQINLPETVTTVCEDTSLDLVVNDAHGDPIPNMFLRVLDVTQKKNTNTEKSNPANFPALFNGKTNAQGKLPPITGLKIGTRFEIQVRKDNGEYTFAGLGTIAAPNTTACLKSPRVRFEMSTYEHQGKPGLAEKKKAQIVKSHNQKPERQPNISRQAEVKPKLEIDRDSAGNPKAVIKDGAPNMYGEHKNDAAAPGAGLVDLDKVKLLIEFGTEQAGWKHPKSKISAKIIEEMKKGVYQPDGKKEAIGYKNSWSSCTKYVKIALWKAGFSHNNGDLAPTVSPAREMGPALIKAGFQDVTAQLPDARWAAPGDVIVYQRKGAPTETGHIDIRTYDGYLSDFLDYYLPVRGFVVTGIYRKYYDPLPEKRMRAFLMVLASREAKTIFLSDGYKETYRTLPASPGHPKEKFSSFKTHPFFGKNAKNSASGAYGILLDTWERILKVLNIATDAAEDLFSPIMQDRIAVVIMELAGNSLGFIRKGEIEKAATILATKLQWTSLPNGRESNEFTTAMMVESYNKFLKEIM